MGTELPTTIAVGHWLNHTERIFELTQFKYGWRAEVVDQQTKATRRIKQTEFPEGLEVVGFQKASLDAPVTLPWPVGHAPVEELEAELAESGADNSAADVMVPATSEAPASEGEAATGASVDTSPPAEDAPIAEVPPTQPPPGPTGYQPAAGEGVTSVFVTANEGDTSVSATLSFPAPRAWAEAQPAVADLVQALRTQVREDQQPGTSEPVVPGSGDPALGSKPSGETFPFRPVSAVSTYALTQGALAHAQALGLPVDQLVVWDNRIGHGGLEADPPGKAWGIAAVKAEEGGSLFGLEPEGDGVRVGDRALAYVGLNADTLRHTVTLTKLGRAVVASLTTPQEVVNQ